ncbi:MAG: DHA2 family efflux MFS transporter permease subunit [Acidimicrobiales bacterium]|nr:DHA2 family efflux MFS transporter permease subunit [Acidimicrobiales bacterium]
MRNRPRAYWYAVGTVCIGAFMGQLDASIVNLAYRPLEASFHATLGEVTWVGLSYLLTLVALVASVGHFADMIGRKLLYTYGFVVFIVGSALCGLAPNLVALGGFRVLQGVGAAMLQANSVAIIYVVMPPHELGRGIGVQGAAQALGLALGPTVGGFLVALGGWRLIFYVNVPAGLVACGLAWFLIPRSRHLRPQASFDWPGFGLLLPAVVSLLMVISLGNDWGWGAPLTVALLVVSVVLFSCFVVRERRARDPLVDPQLFRRVPFTAGISSGLLAYLALFGVLLVVPLLLEGALGLGSARAGLELTVMPVALGLVAPFAGRVADRIGARPLTVAGMLVSSVALVCLALFHGHFGAFIACLAGLGVGLGLFTPPNNAAIMGSAPQEQSGAASGILNMTRGMGTAMGLAFTGLVYGAVVGAATSASAVSAGFRASALFLAGICLVAVVLAAVRGKTALAARSDPGPT